MTLAVPLVPFGPGNTQTTSNYADERSDDAAAAESTGGQLCADLLDYPRHYYCYFVGWTNDDCDDLIQTGCWHCCARAWD